MLSIALYRFDSKINLWGIKWLEAYPTFAMVGCAAKPSSPTLRKTLKAHTHLLGPKRSILAGLIKFLAVGCGFNEVSPWANAVDWLFHY
jgi:hypothetical protein